MSFTAFLFLSVKRNQIYYRITQTNAWNDLVTMQNTYAKPWALEKSTVNCQVVTSANAGKSARSWATKQWRNSLNILTSPFCCQHGGVAACSPLTLCKSTGWCRMITSENSHSCVLKNTWQGLHLSLRCCVSLQVTEPSLVESNFWKKKKKRERKGIKCQPQILSHSTESTRAYFHNF